MITYSDMTDGMECVVKISSGEHYRIVAKSYESDSYNDPPRLTWLHGVRIDHGTVFHLAMTPGEVRSSDECPVPSPEVIPQAMTGA